MVSLVSTITKKKKELTVMDTKLTISSLHSSNLKKLLISETTMLSKQSSLTSLVITLLASGRVRSKLKQLVYTISLLDQTMDLTCRSTANRLLIIWDFMEVEKEEDKLHLVLDGMTLKLTTSRTKEELI